MEPASVERRHRHPRRAAGSGAKPLHLSRSSRRFAAYAEHMAAEGSPTPSLARLADEMRESADELALEVIEEGLTEDQLPSLERLGREGQLSDTIDRLVTECVVAYFDRATLELASQALRDPLTQLLNHQAFTDGLEAELDRARRYQHGATLVFFDIDRFKSINDTYGHPEGDRVLREVARLLKEGRRGSDLAGRMGGDEFAVALIESEPDAGDHFLTRLQERIAAADVPTDFSISAGQAHFPSEGDNSVELLRVADLRLYEAKRTPRES